MAITTKHNVTVEIDDKSFSIVVSENMSASQKDEFEASRVKHSLEFEKRDSIQAELNVSKEEFEINKQILENGTLIEKAKVMFEQKSLNRKIFDLGIELSDIDKNITNLGDAMQELYAKRYDLVVSGADKEALKKEALALGVSYDVLFREFTSEIAKSKEKK